MSASCFVVRTYRMTGTVQIDSFKLANSNRHGEFVARSQYWNATIYDHTNDCFDILKHVMSGWD